MTRRKVEGTSASAAGVLAAVNQAPTMTLSTSNGTTPAPAPVPLPMPAQLSQHALSQKPSFDMAAERARALATEMSKQAEPEAKVPDALTASRMAKPETSTGDEVEVTWAEEMYGKQGTFSSYRVGPFRIKGRVMTGETRLAAMKRLMDDLAEIAKAERERARAAFCAHFPVAFEVK